MGVEGQGIAQRLQVRALLQERFLQPHTAGMEVLLEGKRPQDAQQFYKGPPSAPCGPQGQSPGDIANAPECPHLDCVQRQLHHSTLFRGQTLSFLTYHVVLGNTNPALK